MLTTLAHDHCAYKGFQTYQHLTQFFIWNTLLRMKIPAYNRGEVVDKAPASGATFFRKLIKKSKRNKSAKQEEKTCCHDADPVKTESPGGVTFLRNLFSRREGMCREDSDSTLQTYTSMFDDEEEEEEEEENLQLQPPQSFRSEFTLKHKVSKPAMRTRDQPTPIIKKTNAPRPTPIIKDTRIPLELKLVVASCRGDEVDKPPSSGAFIWRKSHRGSNGSKTNKTKKKVSFRLDKPKSELNVQAPQSFYQLMIFDGNLVPKRVYPEPRAFYQLILVDGNLVPKRVTRSPSHCIEHS
jgi:hypothetical protein